MDGRFVDLVVELGGCSFCDLTLLSGKWINVTGLIEELRQ
jgi:hypothetical protein